MSDILPLISVGFNIVSAICFLVAIFNSSDRRLHHDFSVFGWSFLSLGFLVAIFNSSDRRLHHDFSVFGWSFLSLGFLLLVAGIAL